jgi:hypothetical protein
MSTNMGIASIITTTKHVFMLVFMNNFNHIFSHIEHWTKMVVLKANQLFLTQI